MKKEILIAIVIGFVLGLVITFGIWTANKSLKEGGTSQPQEMLENNNNTPIPTQTQEKMQLTIISPEDNNLVNKEKVQIVGKTSPGGAEVAAAYPDGEKIIEADENGDFTIDITLVGGGNEITISAFDNQGNEASKTLNLVYSTAEI